MTSFVLCDVRAAKFSYEVRDIFRIPEFWRWNFTELRLPIIKNNFYLNIYYFYNFLNDVTDL